jgi:hypothetical protein
MKCFRLISKYLLRAVLPMRSLTCGRNGGKDSVMARLIRSIEIYLPLNYNDGRPVAESKYLSLQQELLSRFGGVTSIQRQFPLQGIWQSGTEVYQDRVVVLSVMDYREETQLECLRYLERLKNRLKKKFDQLEILITVAELLAI